MYTRKKAGNRNSLCKPPDVGFNKGFKGTILNMFKEPKETMIKVVKESIMKMSHQLQSFNKETDIKEKWKFWSWKVGLQVTRGAQQCVSPGKE